MLPPPPQLKPRMTAQLRAASSRARCTTVWRAGQLLDTRTSTGLAALLAGRQGEPLPRSLAIRMFSVSSHRIITTIVFLVLLHCLRVCLI